MTKIEAILITGRSILQGTLREERKLSKEYIKSISICELDPKDMEKLGVKDGEEVHIKTKYGSAKVYVQTSTQAPHPGIVFIPLGSIANKLIRPNTDSLGMPSFKGVRAILMK